ncbi:unnamed protein product [Didymodactylos carnosus]|uniref:Uncharacterized protein n=1 Tax=Didymodactylos carnosus TaxID=1234261 RepID=A0A814KKY0_9BILA|nr:unnamed protein product [Didymodactylos carnosus]CAF1100500.1 unnamed protein product [Didymodactylos carnosus]CAF3822628.1 unnamed protein product [Didymodactylos carnosus]CAF3861895.1 unnamed protein product [Didymodactylos carnosus]
MEHILHMKLDKLIEEASIKLHEPVHDTESLNRWKIQMFTFINTIAELQLPSSPQVSQEKPSLDPVDWLSARCVAHQMLDASLDHIQSIRDRPVWRPIPDDVRAALENEPLPEQGRSLSDVCRDVSTYVIPYASTNIHPRFFGWVMGAGTVGGVLADMIAATLNTNNGGGTHTASLVERTVVQWMRQLFGFPEARTGGILVSGTSMATVISMATARRRALENIRQDGLVGGPQLVAYASTEVHGCVAKAFALLGLGSKALQLVPVDDNFRIKVDELRMRIRSDRDKGRVPFCIIGNAGTVNTGAFDNLLELASIARAENIWFHVDGAFGSMVILDPQRQHLVAGIDQADSLAFDFHKWLHCPYDAGCVLIRNIAELEFTFSEHQSYLARTKQGCMGDEPWFCDLGPDLSRSFKALKVWFTLKEHGTVKLGQKIADNCEQAQYLVSLLEKHEHNIRIVRPISLNIVNFRFEPEELDKTDHELIDTFNEDIITNIQTSGIALPTSTHIHNRLCVRVAIVGHRTTCKDLEILVKTLLEFYQTRLLVHIRERE